MIYSVCQTKSCSTCLLCADHTISLPCLCVKIVLLLLLLPLLLLQEFGQLDILVSNAAVNPTAGPLVDTPAGATTARCTACAISLPLQHVGLAHNYQANEPSGSA
jgi:hypothetical protein